MVSLTILGCIVMSYFFMATTSIIKGISALFDTMFDMLEVWAILLLDGVGILVIELLVMLFGGGFWTIFWTVVVIVVICALLGSILSVIGAILLYVFEIALYVVTFVYSVLELALEKLGDWCELGLKYFLGMLNKKIILS